MTLVAVISGDIIGSRDIDTRRWMRTLKKELGKLGKSPRKWELYRGDSFQVEVTNAADALEKALRIKAALRSSGADARIAIGIGTRTYSAKHITQSAGTAFTYSGDTLSGLKKQKSTLAVKSGNRNFDEDMNVCLRLAMIVADRWTVKSATAVLFSFEHPKASQTILGRKLGIRQNTLSRRLQRAHFPELKELIALYGRKTSQLLKP